MVIPFVTFIPLCHLILVHIVKPTKHDTEVTPATLEMAMTHDEGSMSELFHSSTESLPSPLPAKSNVTPRKSVPLGEKTDETGTSESTA